MVTAAGTITGDSVFNGRDRRSDRRTGIRARPDPDGAPVPAGRVTPVRPRARRRRGATCGSRASQIPADAVAVRVVAEDLSLTPGDWIAVTPPRVPEVRSVQEYVGSQQPVLMDWAVGLAFPCQQPMLHANGVTEIPKFRISPDYNAKLQGTDTWQDGLNGGLLGITDLLLRASVMSTYLSHDWGRDWGSLRRFDTIVDAQPARSTSAPPRTAGCKPRQDPDQALGSLRRCSCVRRVLRQRRRRCVATTLTQMSVNPARDLRVRRALCVQTAERAVVAENRRFRRRARTFGGAMGARGGRGPRVLHQRR